jgi:hypothetical protein
VEWGALGGVAVIAVVLFVLKVIFLPTVVYVIAVAGVAYGIWKGRETNTLYTVFLGCALIALLTAVLCLWIELQRYGYNIKAKSRGPQAAVTQSFGLDSPDSSAIGAAKPQEVWAIV